MKISYLPIFPLVLVFAWSAWRPHDSVTWWLEAAPVIIGAVILFVSREKFKLTSLIYILLLVHAIVLLVGAHYTYARVPAFDWLRDSLDLSRNHYDRLGHFVQGFVPAMVARELLLRTSPLRPGKWLVCIIVLSCLGISALYELIEWSAVAFTGQAADNFMGSQGDEFDAQKDMLWALVGAGAALALLSRWHDHHLARLK